MLLFDALGFRWNRFAMLGHFPVHSMERTCSRFHERLLEFFLGMRVCSKATRLPS